MSLTLPLPAPALSRPRSVYWLSWLVLALVLAGLWYVGNRPNGDVDDLLKAHEVRFLLGSGDVFDRTLPRILQPEPFVSHWPWIVDLPYAAPAYLLRPLLGEDMALAAAFFAVPLLLLGLMLVLLGRLTALFGFVRPSLAFGLSVFVGLRALAEFQPGRIDYHNLQMLLLVAIAWLTALTGRRAALACGALVALAFAIGLELTLFMALAIAVRACDYAFGTDERGDALQAFGLALAAAALVLFAAIVPPGSYGQPVCDRYASPAALALVMAGAAFAVLPVMLRRAGPLPRAALLCACGLLAVAALALLFPSCIGSPYGELSDYVRQNWLDRIFQEGALYDHAEPRMLAGFVVPFVGALATGVAALAMRGRDRSWTVAALFAVLAVAHAVLYVRYMRFVPLLAGPGLAYALHAALPPRLGAAFAGRVPAPAQRWLPLAPGVALMLALPVASLAARPAEMGLVGVDVAETCLLDDLEHYQWPAGARVLSPPLVGIHLLGDPSAAVVAIPFHTDAKGIERALRFFDPATADPRSYFARASATHVAVCAWRGEPLTRARRDFPFATGLVEGAPPGWLAECPQPRETTLRIYRPASAPASACPVLAAGG